MQKNNYKNGAKMKREPRVNELMIEIIKKVTLLDTKESLTKVRKCIVDGIVNESDAEDADHVRYESWKEKQEHEGEIESLIKDD